MDVLELISRLWTDYCNFGFSTQDVSAMLSLCKIAINKYSDTHGGDILRINIDESEVMDMLSRLAELRKAEDEAYADLLSDTHSNRCNTEYDDGFTDEELDRIFNDKRLFGSKSSNNDWKQKEECWKERYL